MSAEAPRFLTEDDWAAMFDSFEKSAFRLETLPVYLAQDEYEELPRFLNGEPPPESAENEWIDLIRSSKAAGKTMQRVHVVTPPLSDYLCGRRHVHRIRAR